MSNELERAFLFRVRPAHRETLDSYTRRVAEANFSGVWLRPHLLKNFPDIKGKAAKDSAWTAVLAAKTGRSPLPQADKHGWLRHSDGSSCEFCADLLPSRWMCTLCSHGDAVEQYPHFDDLVCTRHNRWVGLEEGILGQHCVGQPHVLAAHRFRRLRRQGRVDVRLYAVVNRALRTADEGDKGRSEADVFPLTVAVIDAITATHTAQSLLDPTRGYDVSFRALQDLIRHLTGEDSSQLVRSIWLHMRPAAASYRTSLILGEEYASQWVHDFPFRAPATGSPARNRADWDSFNNYLPASGDTTDTATSYGLEGYGHRKPLDESGTPNSHRPAMVVCPEGHEYPVNTTKPEHVQPADFKPRRNRKCTVCANKTVQRGHNDLETQNPQAAAQYDAELNGGVPASQVPVWSSIKYWWRCAEGHAFQATPTNRRYGPLGCPVCLNRQVLVGYNDVATTHPELLNSWHPSSLIRVPPTEHHAGSNELVQWICENEHTFTITIANRAKGGGCDACRQRPAPEAGLDVTHPALAIEWDFEKNFGKTPAEVSHGSGYLAAWLCPIGHRYYKKVEHRARGYGCNICSKRWLEVGVNDLATTQPLLTAELHPYLNNLDPRTTFASNHVFVWLCSANSHKHKQTVPHRIKSRGCPLCAPSERILDSNKAVENSTVPDVHVGSR